VARALDEYRFNDGAGVLYQFVWHEFCDWYLEAIKPTLYNKEKKSEKERTLNVLWYVLRDTLVLLHPFIPFITEEIWQKLPGTEGSIMIAQFPSRVDGAAFSLIDEKSESEMDFIMEIVSGIRNVRGEMNIAPSLSLDVVIQSQDQHIAKTINRYRDIIMNLARLDSVSIAEPGDRPSESATVVVAGATVFVSLGGVVDFTKEAGRLEKEIGKLSSELKTLSKKLSNEDFLNKAPAAVVEKVKAKRDRILEKEQKLESNLKRIKEAGM
jgi:valyl-tRNA synthetase